MAARGALPALALLALAGAGPAAPPIEPHSLVAARWLSERLVETGPCPEPAICVGEIVEARLVDVETLAGRAAPTRLTVRLWTNRTGPLATDYRAILIVRRDGPGMPWVGRLLQSASPGRDSCIRSDWLTNFDMRPRRRSYRRGEQTCFPAA